MAENLRDSIHAIIESLIESAKTDFALRDRLRSVAEEILSRTAVTEPPGNIAETAPTDAVDEPQLKAETEPAPSKTVVPEIAAETAQTVDLRSLEPDSKPAPERPPIDVLMRTLTLGKSVPGKNPIITVPKKYAHVKLDLDSIEKRCRLKAEAARWVSRRQTLLDAGADFKQEIAPHDRTILARGKSLPNCHLWMCDAYFPHAKDHDSLAALAGCYETLADATALTRTRVLSTPLSKERLIAAAKLMAEAKCVLRTILEKLGNGSDKDQVEAHEWLSTTAKVEQFYLKKYMKKDDRGDPESWPNLLDRIRVEGERHGASKAAQSSSKTQARILDRIRHKVSNFSADRIEWPRFAADVEELIVLGLPPSNVELRNLLLPVLDEIPENLDIPPGFRLVLREIDRFLVDQPEIVTERNRELSAEVATVANLLKGKCLLMIGGECRQASKLALTKAFRLDELIWSSVREHESISIFEPAIKRPEVVAVLLAIRWSSHSYGEVKPLCDTLAKPLVRLPGGYNVNQVASQILTQASHRLATVIGES